MKFDQINESIIKVPKSTVNSVNQYVSSMLYFKVKQYMENYDRMAEPGMKSHPAADKIKQRSLQECQKTLSVLSSKYGAKNISSSSYNQILNNHIKMPFDAEQYINELNFKKLSTEILNSIKNISLELVVVNDGSSRERGKLVTNDNDKFEVHINTSMDVKEIYANCMKIMSTVYHELQHFVQRSVIAKINDKSNQLQIKKKYHDSSSEYYSSGIEFTPQLGNVIDAMQSEASKMKDDNDLPNDPKEAFNKVLQEVLGRDDLYGARQFIIHNYKNSEKKYRTIMTTLYKKFMDNFEELQTSTDDNTHVTGQEEDLQIENNHMRSLAKLISAGRYTETKMYGKDMDNITSLETYNKEQKWIVKITPSRGDIYTIVFKDATETEREQVNYNTVYNFLGTLASMDFTSDEVIEFLDELANSSTDERGDVEKLISKLSEWTNMIGLETNPNDDGITINNIKFVIEPIAGRVSVESPQLPKMFLVGSINSITDAFRYILRFMKESPDELLNILNQDKSLVQIKKELRSL